MSVIKTVFSREILDSRGWPTVETEITTSEGVFRASAPSGASTGSFEALELRDGGRSFLGRGVRKAVGNVNKVIAPKLVGEDALKQKQLDGLLVRLDGTKNKSKLGANAVLSASMAVAKAGAAARGMEVYEYLAVISGRKPKIPVPMFNMINGGKHAGLNNDLQEHLVSPGKKIRSFGEVMRFASEVFHEIGARMRGEGKNPALVADEGGVVFGKTPAARLELIAAACKSRGFSGNFKLGLDCAATEFFSNGRYKLGARKLSAGGLSKVYEKLADEYAVFSFEDPFAEEDWGAWVDFSKTTGKKMQVVGDDLLATNPDRIKKAIKLGACNALLLKPNQVGTVTETINAFSLAKRAGWGVVASHRSGETEDVFIAHLAVGLGCDSCKFGAPDRGERAAKYNELLRISEKVRYSGVVS